MAKGHEGGSGGLAFCKKIVTKLERVWYLADNSCSLYSRICGKLPTF
jgi:hypothetical protein